MTSSVRSETAVAARTRLKSSTRRRLVGVALIAPAVVILVVFFVYPLIGVAIRSFTEPVTGLDNYRQLYSSAGFRTVRDTAAVLDAVSGPAVGDPYSAPLPGRPFRDEVGADPGRLRVGLLVADPSDLIETDPECRLAVEETGRVLETLGHIVEQAHPKALTEYGDVRRHFGRVVSCLTASDLSDWERTTERVISEKDVEPVNWEIAQAGRRRSVDDYLYSLNWLHSWARRMQQWWADGFDLLVTPTMGVPPLHIGALASSPGDPLAGMRAAGPVVVYTVPYNITGQPAVSLPLHTTEAGLPVGVQLVAEYGGEDLLIRVASLLEQAQPWNTRRPPLHG